jgi:hypothetical protein
MAEMEDVERVINHQIRITEKTYDRAVAYTNLVIVAGYAGFFGLWQITKDYLCPREVVWAALFMSTSIFIFVIFEVAKTYYVSRRIKKIASVIFDTEAKKNIQTLKAAYDKFEIEESKENIIWYRFWIWTFTLTLIFGVLGFLVLGSAFISRLWDCAF